MPELPEAENIGRALKRAMCGRSICKVEVFSPMMRTSLLPLADAALEGKTIVDVRRRGRYLVAELDDTRGLLMHFGMSGVVRLEPASVPKRKHEHVFIHLSDGNIFRFECTRRFSLLELHPGCANGSFPAVLDKLGVEPLSEEFNGGVLFAAFRKRSSPVKTALMDNSIVVGIGNIYANETLFICRVAPTRKACDVTRSECDAIAGTAKKVLLRAIECGGTTISDFQNVDGSEGKFVQELQIYGKAGIPCPHCGTPVSSVRLGGRNSFFCPQCQK
ncbi:MAG: bifunctional DNA-formamidopyrimidine glycosylase/DNA-(apurinic or apyrimidinic site) lyase [Lentisphaeria bacterium]|nr:bifunctional DNA-formamidopyrimidine glycosylase/DNA-(apurinic or apyrimidinic site) lyase [Lentisphaeria bacterium]